MNQPAAGTTEAAPAEKPGLVAGPPEGLPLNRQGTPPKGKQKKPKTPKTEPVKK
jgi:hypothetical protein